MSSLSKEDREAAADEVVASVRDVMERRYGAKSDQVLGAIRQEVLDEGRTIPEILKTWQPARNLS